MTVHFKHSHWWKWWSRSKVIPYLRLRDQWRMWMQDDGCKVYMDSYMASNGSCFMVTWIISKNHLLEVGMTQNTGRWHSEFIGFYHVWRPCVDRNSNWLRAWSHYIWGFVTTLHDFGSVLGRLLDTFFRAPTISWSRLLAHECMKWPLVHPNVNYWNQVHYILHPINSVTNYCVRND